ncbi:GNAT family N-acetyltransferase [Sporomusa sp.]|uniref:GNAT family N-acetyltransferase n=1 Tax=Sporomusa sp. TaxID=2078658 RepID=UPI002C24C54B|nr:GNAT family N-acetyltransferase [Sporomusa sp.]HWR08600.1 GNAT family N-acetyltransferase [Sporomusa sp.]
MSETVRLIRYEELEKLLVLYKKLNPDDPEFIRDGALDLLWSEIHHDPGLHYLVLETQGELVATCALAIIKNLTRNARPYGLIENVVTHPDYRKRGYGTKVLHKALDIAQENNCYKVMLLTGSKKEETLRFYEKAGFPEE